MLQNGATVISLSATPPIVITLSGEPRAVGRPRFARKTGHAYTPAETRKYQSALRLAAQDVMGDNRPLEGPLKVLVVALFPIPKSFSKKKHAAALEGKLLPTVKPDADNLLKQLDSFNQVVWRDDKQITSATVVKHYSDKPLLHIEVSPL